MDDWMREREETKQYRHGEDHDRHGKQNVKVALRVHTTNTTVVFWGSLTVLRDPSEVEGH